MMGVNARPSRGEHLISNCYLGTRAAGLEGFSPEDFSVQLYDYPEMTITANGYDIPDYGSVDAFIDGNIKTVSYGTVFGQDLGELIFDTGRDGENLLVLSDSYDNALIKPLAASFSKTYSIDLRAFSEDTGGFPFDLAAYIPEHSIDKVIVIGALEYFNGSSF